MIGKPYIDFNFLNTNDPKYLWVGDLSHYLFLEPKPAIVQVTLPGNTEAIEFTWDKNNVNIFNSNNLKLSCIQNCSPQDYIDLPDGIYKVKVIASPDTFFKERYYLKTDKFQLDLSKVRFDLFVDRGYSETLHKWSLEIDMLITVAKDAAAIGKIQDAKRFFDEALSLLNKNKDCKNCY